ncbi:MAG: hypothetical protein FJZ01_19060 [Candidatus Sericytochromatia bacterium]|nr:hypothetical protein [Candidatus Tanganyikabacteria bacterium]
MATSSRGLRAHLALALLAAGGLPLVLAIGSGALLYRDDARRIEEALGAEALASARSAADHLQFLLAGAEAALNRLSKAAEEGRLSNRLIEVERAELPFLAGLFVTDPRGVVRFGSPAEIGRSLATSPSFGEMQARRETRFVATLRSVFAPEDVVAVGHRDFAGGNLVRIVGSRIRTSHLEDLLDSYSPVKLNDAIYVFDRDGRVLAAAGSARLEVGTVSPGHPLLVAGRRSATGWQVYDSPLFGRPRIGGWVAMPGTGWTVVSARDRGTSLQDLRARWLAAGGGVLATGLLVVALALGLARRLSRPLEDLAGAMHREREEGLQRHPVPSLPAMPVRADIREIADLVASYNALVEALNRRFVEVAAFEELQRLAHDLQGRNEEIQAQSEELQAQSEELQAQNEEIQAQNEELERVTAEAVSASRHKNEFLANVSHELRTPLNSIIGYSELILAVAGPRLDAVSRENLGVVLRNGRHLLGLINEILDISRIEVGKVAVHPTEFDPGLVLADLAAATEALAADKGLRLVTELPAGVGPVLTDETRFRQIVLNLLGNAIKFTPAGEVRLSLAAAGAERIAVTVSDTGIGIPPDQREAVFEEFRKAAGAESPDAEGVGLGLAISRRLARLLGGDLALESAEGAGSKFTLDLPRRLRLPSGQGARA